MKIIPYLFLGSSEIADKALEFYKGFGIKVEDEMRASKKDIDEFGFTEGQLMHVKTIWGSEDNVIYMCASPDGKVYGTVMLEFDEGDLNFATMKKIYDYFAKDGVVKNVLQKTYWNANYAHVMDKFGIHWQFNQSLSQ